MMCTIWNRNISQIYMQSKQQLVKAELILSSKINSLYKLHCHGDIAHTSEHSARPLLSILHIAI